jgi:hypothetical protein
MNGNILYGTIGRLLSAISYVTILIMAMQVGGMFQFLPPKVAAFILALGATLTAFSERLQGGASDPATRTAAAASDAKNKAEGH